MRHQPGGRQSYAFALRAHCPYPRVEPAALRQNRPVKTRPLAITLKL